MPTESSRASERTLGPAKDLRWHLKTLTERGELYEVRKRVHPLAMSALMSKSDRPLLFHSIAGYDEMTAVAQLFSNRNQVALAMSAEPHQLSRRFTEVLKKPVQPEIVSWGPVLENRITNPTDVDLSLFPLPVLHQGDGGPYISAGVMVSEDPVEGRNVGMYRMMYRTPNTTGIDLVSNSDLSGRYRRAYEQGKSLPVAVAIGLHPCDYMAADFMAPKGTDEFTIAGALKGEPIPLLRLPQTGIPVPAYSEVALEGELLPTGWTEPEGPFGEFQRIQGGVHMNPLVRVTAVYHRNNPIFHVWTMPWEVWTVGSVNKESMCLEALAAARVDVVNVHATRGSVGFQVIASIRKKPGQGKLALMALLALGTFKQAIIVDEDIDVFDPTDVDWAVATRVRADRDVVIIPDCRCKPLDPSCSLPGNPKALNARWGIDATIPDDRDPAGFLKAEYALPDIRLEDYL